MENKMIYTSDFVACCHCPFQLGCTTPGIQDNAWAEDCPLLALLIKQEEDNESNQSYR